LTLLSEVVTDATEAVRSSVKVQELVLVSLIVTDSLLDIISLKDGVGVGGGVIVGVSVFARLAEVVKRIDAVVVRVVVNTVDSLPDGDGDSSVRET
jgi:hypothetical protein